MTRSLSEELRTRVVKARLSGERVEEVAARSGVGRDGVSRWVALYKATGTLTPRPRGVSRPAKIQDLEKFRTCAEAHPGGLLSEMARAWGGVRGMCIRRTLRRIGWSRKKTLGCRKRDAAGRQAFLDEMRTIPPDQVVFVDETGMDDIAS